MGIGKKIIRNRQERIFHELYGRDKAGHELMIDEWDDNLQDPFKTSVWTDASVEGIAPAEPPPPTVIG